MKKIKKENYFELAAFLMDYHSGQWSRGYRLLSKLNASNFGENMLAELRDGYMYQYLADTYGKRV